MSGMKILRIEAEKVKRLRAVRLDLQGGNLVVVGKPDAGKTTAMDLAWMAFRGRAIGPETISEGADEARITVVIGDPGREYTVTRKLTRDGEPSGKLTVKSKDGGAYGAKFLDGLISDLTFDPTEFARSEGRAQVDLLLKVVKLPGGMSIEAMDKVRAALYEKRTMVNRDLDKLKAKQAGEEPPSVEFVQLARILERLDAELEAVRTAGTARLTAARTANKERMAAARATNEENKAKRAKLEEFKKSAFWQRSKIQETQDKIAELQGELLKLEASKAKVEVAIAQGEPIIAALVDTDEDGLFAQMEAERATIETEQKVAEAPILARRSTAVADAEVQNKQALAREVWEENARELAETAAAVQDLTDKINQVDANKKALLEKVEWPMEGLGIRDGHVTYNDVILSQCGTSVRMRVSCAIAMAMNPQLNTIRIDEGESLGAEGRAEVFQWAADKGFQVLMSIVKDGPAEDGELEIIEDTLTNIPTPAVALEVAA